MEQRFNISGTHDELQMILEKEFNLSPDAARVAVAVFVYEQNQEWDSTQLNEDTLWFLNGSQDDYQNRIFSTRYTISFSKVMLDVIDDLVVPGVLALCGAGELAVLGAVLYSVKALVKNLRHVKDNECCVYFQTLQYLKTHSGKWFSSKEVIPLIGDESLCINLDKRWNCRFRCGEEKQNCKIQLEDVKGILEAFCIDNVMESNEDKTMYKYKI